MNLTENKTILCRSELYDLVWSQTMSRLAQQFGISGTGLRKICIRYSIPIPAAGHWAKIHSGQQILKAKLPNAENKEIEIIATSKDVKQRYRNRRKENELRAMLNADENLIERFDPDKPHPLVVAAKKKLRERIKDKWYHGGIIQTYGPTLNICVYETQIERSLRIMDLILKILEKRGHSVVFENERPHVLVNEEKIAISLKEKERRVQDKESSYPAYKLVSTGKLAFRLHESYKIKEFTDKLKILEDQIPDIIAKLEAEATKLKEERVILEAHWEAQRKEEAIREAIQKKKDDELIAFKQLLKNAKLFKRATLIRNYIEGVKRKWPVPLDRPEEISRWLEWAEAKADWCDPTIDKEDALLESFEPPEENTHPYIYDEPEEKSFFARQFGYFRRP